MFNFFHNFGLGVMSASAAFTGAFHSQPSTIIQPPQTQVVSTTTQNLSASISTQSAPVTPKQITINKNTPVVKTIDNSAVIQAAVQAQVQATLKARADQDALVVKQKADAQAAADKQAQLDAQQKVQAQAVIDAQNAANLKAQQQAQLQKNAEIQAQIDAQQQAAQDAIQAKKEQLNAINQQIAALNAKYASDLKNLTSNSSITQEQAAPMIQDTKNRYEIDYATLKAQWQAIYYGN